MTKEEIINKYGKYTDSIDITWDKGDIAYILISEGIVDESSSDFKELADLSQKEGERLLRIEGYNDDDIRKRNPHHPYNE